MPLPACAAAVVPSAATRSSPESWANERRGSPGSVTLSDGDACLSMDLLHKCIGGTAVSAVGVEVVVDLERVDRVFRLEYVHGEEIAVDCLEHRERDVAEPLGVP